MSYIVSEFPCNSKENKSKSKREQRRIGAGTILCLLVLSGSVAAPSFCLFLSPSVSVSVSLVMGFFRKIAGLLGFAKDDFHDSKDDAEDEPDAQPPTTPFRVNETGLPRKVFSVPAQVVVDRPQLGPVVAPSTSGDGGVQGLRWYAERLRIDEDGDVADEFLDEVSSETSLAADHHKPVARFKLKYGARPVKVNRQVLSDGKLQLCVEHQL